MDGRMARRTGEWGGKAGVGEWTGGMDGWGDHWMGGRIARWTVEWGGKAGVSEWTGWMDGETIGWTALGALGGRKLSVLTSVGL